MSIRANSCPCCGGSLLRHVRHGELYWFCKTCWQEVPLLTATVLPSLEGRSTGVIPQSAVKS
ncbi:MAG: hypothetical protein KME30_11575 [Iphinoe sp. HA4291-MV1]|jgi:ribosomal protein L37AE/L43A|nr:hypothetical protein [Iphinoe sp. HA4291-MV1]